MCGSPPSGDTGTLEYNRTHKDGAHWLKQRKEVSKGATHKKKEF